MGRTTIIAILGILLSALGLGMLLCALLALFYQEEDLLAFLLSGVLTLCTGLITYFLIARKKKIAEISHKGACLIVTLGWLLSCLFGALPYYFYAHLPGTWYKDAPLQGLEDIEANTNFYPPNCVNETGIGHEFCSFTNSVFESTSGFTTTGATILKGGLWDNPNSRKGGLPHALLFWRSFSQFLGGMGIILFGLAVLPFLGIGGMQLYKAEVTGPIKDKVAPRAADTAKFLWIIYLGLTLLETFLLFIFTDSGFYLALVHSFSTLATGGFSPLSSSIETLSCPTTEWIITVFMFLGGISFGLHFMSLRRRKAQYFKNDEFKFYFFIVLFFSLALSVLLYFRGETFNFDLRTAAFQVVSLLTTSGFSSVDYASWSDGIGFFLILLFFIGGCSGSTAGGIKSVRILLMLKLAQKEIWRLIHPHAVIKTKLSNVTVSEKVINSVAAFLTVYLFIYLVSVCIFALSGADVKTAISLPGATLGNIGPGIGAVGPSCNYNFFSNPIKWYQMFLMVIGRLELFSVLIILTPEFWKK